jgi:hypothetical protein
LKFSYQIFVGTVFFPLPCILPALPFTSCMI